METPPNLLPWLLGLVVASLLTANAVSLYFAHRWCTQANRLIESIRAMALSIASPTAAARLEARRQAEARKATVGPKSPLIQEMFGRRDTAQRRFAQTRAADQPVPLKPGQFRYHNPTDTDLVPPTEPGAAPGPPQIQEKEDDK
jgi:hypothetical protein